MKSAALGAGLLLMACVTAALAMEDGRLARVQAALPAGWHMTRKTDRLYLVRDGDIWVLSVNRINAAVSRETEAEREARVRGAGKRGQAQLVFRLEPRWSAAKVDKTRAANTALERQIAALPEKHGIAGLVDERLSRKGSVVFIPRNDDDKRRIAAYEAERIALSRRVVALPVYQSDRYSIFPLLVEGRDDDMHEVWPAAASREVYQVERALGQICPP